VVQEDRWITVTDIANKLDISCRAITCKDFRYHKICTRWVPKQLTDEYKWAYIETCIQFYQQYHEVGEAFLQWIVTGNETWQHHYEPASKCQSMERKYISLPMTKKFKSVPSAGKVTLMLFWDCNRPIFK